MTASLSLHHVVRPPAAPPAPGDRAPLLVLLHGVGGNEDAMLALAPAVDPRFLVVSARGPIVLGPRAFGWFHVTFTPQGPAIDADEAAASWAAITRFVDEAVSAYDADPARVYLAGFSQGAIMGLATLLTAPSRVAGVVAMSGRLLPEVLPHAAPAAALDGKAVLIVHGTDDNVVAYPSGEYEADYWSYVNGCAESRAATTPAPCQRQSQCPSDKPVVFCGIAGLGHALWQEAAKTDWAFFSTL